MDSGTSEDRAEILAESVHRERLDYYRAERQRRFMDALTSTPHVVKEFLDAQLRARPKSG